MSSLWSFLAISDADAAAVQAGRPTPAGQQWVELASRGELVSPAQRNAFIAERSGCMDLLVNPGLLVEPSSAHREVYRGPIEGWHGREVAALGGLAPPSSWWKGSAVRSAGSVGGGSKASEVLALLAPTEAERRRLWVAHYNTLKGLRRVEVVRDPSARDAGAVPLVVVVAVAAVVAVGLISAAVAWYYSKRVHEEQETARHAAELQTATQEWMTRAQESIRRGTPIPPGPAEVALQTRAEAAARAQNGGGGSENPFADVEKWLTRAGVALGVGLVAVEVVPTVLRNVADNATRGAR